MNDKLQKKKRRKARSKKGYVGTADRPRLSVFRSNAHIYAQIINDMEGKTKASMSDKDISKQKKKKMTGTEIAYEVGNELAKLAKKKKIKKVFFDRSGHKYHGQIKQLAEGARKGGLDF